MKPRTKFLVGGALVLGAAGYLMTSSINSTGVYYLTPTELANKTAADPSFYKVGVKVGAWVVPGSIVREPNGRETSFRMTDGKQAFNVVYRGLTPDTFEDSVDVVVEGRLGRDQTFHATTLLAKCASRYEAVPEKPKFPVQAQIPEQAQQQAQPISAQNHQSAEAGQGVSWQGASSSRTRSL